MNQQPHTSLGTHALAMLLLTTSSWLKVRRPELSGTKLLRKKINCWANTFCGGHKCFTKHHFSGYRWIRTKLPTSFCRWVGGRPRRKSPTLGDRCRHKRRQCGRGIRRKRSRRRRCCSPRCRRSESQRRHLSSCCCCEWITLGGGCWFPNRS